MDEKDDEFVGTQIKLAFSRSSVLPINSSSMLTRPACRQALIRRVSTTFCFRSAASTETRGFIRDMVQMLAFGLSHNKLR